MELPERQQQAKRQKRARRVSFFFVRSLSQKAGFVPSSPQIVSIDNAIFFPSIFFFFSDKIGKLRVDILRHIPSAGLKTEEEKEEGKQAKFLLLSKRRQKENMCAMNGRKFR